MQEQPKPQILANGPGPLQRCGRCQHARPHHQVATRRMCFLNPPTVHLVAMQNVAQQVVPTPIMVRPTVEEGDCCQYFQNQTTELTS